jgi:transglutaminase-like putative cysteine protease
MSNDPPYLQTVVYDTLADTGQWESFYTAGEQDTSTLPTPAGLTNPGAFPQYKDSVTVSGGTLNGRPASFLALPYPATSVTTPPGDWRTDPNLMVFLSPSTITVQSYQASYAAVDPTSAELNGAAAPPGLAADLALPKSFQTAALKQIAETETAGYKTEFGKVNALASWLASAFTYKADSAPVNSPASLLSFLTKTRTGVCVQSAYAMTVLTRLLGVPARLAGGFTEGTKKGNSYLVTTDDAHAWAEVYFTGYGWIKFEATPSGGDGSARASSYQSQTAGSNSGGQNGFDTIGPTAGATSTAGAPGAGIRKLPPDESGQEATAGTGGTAGTPWAALALAVAAAIALAFAVIALVAPPGTRAQQPPPADGVRRRRPRIPPAALAVTAVAAIVALALYRLLSGTSGLNLGVGWATVGIAFAATAAVVLVVPGVSRLARRRWRWLRAHDDASRAHAAWRELRDDLADLGVRCPPSEPPRTLAARVSAGLPDPAREAVGRLAVAEERACYAAQPGPSQDLQRDEAAARRGLEASAGPGGRWRARIFPASIMTSVADWAAGAPDRLTALIRHQWTERRSES